MKYMQGFVSGTLVLLLLLSTPLAAAQGLTEREERMMQLIEDLEKRVTELEKALPEKPAPAAAPRPPTSFELPSGATPLTPYWKEGLHFDSADGDFKLQIGGRTQVDFAKFNQDGSLKTGVGDVENGVEFRRARFHIRGTIYEDYAFKAQYDFAGGKAGFRDVYLAMNHVPHVGQIKVGHFYEPMSLEQMTTDLYTTFMERSLMNDLLPERNTGIAISNTALDQNLTWALGVYRDTDGFGNGANDSGGMSVTGRVTWLPWYKEGGEQLFHVGGSASFRDIDGTTELRARPEAHLSPLRFVDTQSFQADGIRLFGGEMVFVHGPYSLQSEILQVRVKLKNGGTEDLSGFYIFGSAFLTGEHRPYSKRSGAFGRVRPNSNFGFGEDGGWGAWELALRYSEIDLNDSVLRGGEEKNVTLGVNWYLNPNMKTALNFVHGEIDHDLYKGDIDVVEARFQVDF